jgi:hypothetical protein
MNQGKSLGWYANQRPYIYEDWAQPSYTSNTGNPDGAVFAASSEKDSLRFAYQAMDGNLAASGLHERRPNDPGPAWWKVLFPFKIRITQLTHQNTYRSGSQIAGSAGIIGHYFADGEATIPIGDQFDSGGTSVSLHLIYDSQTPIITNTIYLVKTASTGGDTTNGTAGIGEVVLEASKIIYEVAER